MTYFIRTEESKGDAFASLERKKSIRRWNHMGCSIDEHFLFALPDSEKEEVLLKLGFSQEDFWSISLADFFREFVVGEFSDEELAEAMNLTELEDGGFAEFLPGLCSLESFDFEPTPEDCTETLWGELFRYTVCYEGEFVGYDPDEGWELFIPHRIVWVSENEEYTARWKECEI